MSDSSPEKPGTPSTPEGSSAPEAPNRATPAEISEMMAKNLRMRTKRVPRAVRRNYFLYLLFYEGFFRWAVAAAVLCVLIVIALVPRIWITSPEGYSPIQKVRGLDIIQCASFRRAAAREAAAGRDVEAVQKWRAALASDPVNTEATRGFVKALAALKVADPELLPQGVYEAGQLMKLAGTNENTITVCSEFYLRYNQFSWLLETLNKPDGPKNLTATRGLMAALLFTDQFPRLGEVLKERAALIQGDPDAELYRQAWQSVQGSPSESKAAYAALETAAEDPARRVTALRLLLFLDQKELRVAEFERHLKAYEAIKEARFHDRFVHLLLLKSVGRSQDAQDLARNSLGTPDSPTEVVQLIQVWSEFQMYDEAAKFAREQLARFKYSPAIWVQLGQLLVTGKSWDELRGAGIQLRGVELVRPILGNYGFFLEGAGLRGQRRDEAADDAFGKFVEQPTVSEEINFESAITMSKLGYPNRALGLVKSMVGSTNAGAYFWKQYLLVAYEAKAAREMLLAAGKLKDIGPTKLDPTGLDAKNDYAATLLTLRENPVDALQLTLELVNLRPESTNFQINHAQALAQTHRFSECEALLKSLPRATLNMAQQLQFDLAMIEVYALTGRPGEARATAERVNRNLLFPEQLKWLDKTLAALPKG